MRWQKFILGCQVGNILEWYDFILYGYFSAILAPVFFPAENLFISQLIAFSVFASGCVLRPLGSLFFGYIGDRHGRHSALLITIVLITLSTTAVGLLPTYAQIGIWAPILLTVCRLVQGVAVSGEEIGAAILLSENAPSSQRAFASSLIFGSVYIGLLCGAIMAFAVIGGFSEAILQEAAWRIPFLGAFIIGVIAIRIRLRDKESPIFLSFIRQHPLLPFPVLQVFTAHWRAVLRTFLLCAAFATSIYLTVVFMPSYYHQELEFSFRATLFLSIVGLLFLSIAVPCIGYLADKIGSMPLFLSGCLGYVFFSYPIFWLLVTKQVLPVVLAHALLSIFLAMIAGSVFPILLRQFPLEIRFTGIALGFNVSMMVFGSLAPIAALALVNITHEPTAPFVCLLFSGLISLCAVPLFVSVHEQVEWIDEWRMEQAHGN